MTAVSMQKGSFSCRLHPTIPPHTLILGTQPGDLSLQQSEYYNTHTNAFWHIVGDALGWRRGWLDGKGRGTPTSIMHCLLHSNYMHTYEEAVSQLTTRGYALWDVLCESEREGSLDSSIKKERPADVRRLVQEHPSIRTICFASGGTTASFFKRHFKEWLSEPGAFVAAANSASQQSFGKLLRDDNCGTIRLVVMESVSPAYVPMVSTTSEAKRRAAYIAAGRPDLLHRASAYAWKRQQWFDDCFYRELSVADSAKRFGDRKGDFLLESPSSAGGKEIVDVKLDPELRWASKGSETQTRPKQRQRLR